jgi:hypothetical protein
MVLAHQFIAQIAENGLHEAVPTTAGRSSAFGSARRMRGRLPVRSEPQRMRCRLSREGKRMCGHYGTVSPPLRGRWRRAGRAGHGPARGGYGEHAGKLREAAEAGGVGENHSQEKNGTEIFLWN